MVRTAFLVSPSLGHCTIICLFAFSASLNRTTTACQDSSLEQFEQEEAPGIVQFIPLDSGVLQINKGLPREDYLREVLISELTQAELELAGTQQIDYKEIVENWKDAYQVFLKQFDIDPTDAEKIYSEKSRSYVDRINKLLLPHQKVALALTIRRFLLRSVGLAELINRSSFRQQHEISLHEFRTVLTSSNGIATDIIESSNTIRKRVLEKCLAALPKEVQETVREALITNRPKYESLEFLDWQLSLVIDSSISAKFFENECNSVEQMLVSPQFNSEIDGSLSLQINDHREYGHLKLSRLVEIVTSSPISKNLDFELQDAEIQFSKNLVTEMADFETVWNQRQVDWKERYRLREIEATLRLDQFHDRILTPERQAKLTLVIQAINIQRLGIFRALVNDELGPRYLLTDTQKKEFEIVVKAAQTELRESSRKLENEILERQFALLTDTNAAKIREFFGPELKYSRGNTSLLLFNVQNLR